MKKLLTLMLTISVLTGCASNPSAFESGWTQNSNQDALAKCGAYRSNHREYRTVLDQLVDSGALTPSQANRAIERDVRMGDPECLAFAAYGLDTTNTAWWNNVKGQATKVRVTYECKENNIPCPGVEILFTDGKVISIKSL